MFPSEVPTVVSIAFLIAFCFPVLLVARLARKAQWRNGFAKTLGFYLVYLAVVASASLSGFYDAVMLPPKIVVTTTLPFAVFMTILYLTPRCREANRVLSLPTLVQVHIFRLVGSFFIFLFLLGQLPKPFALIAGCGDVITALSSIFVARAIRQQQPYARRLTYVWNTFGLLDILATSAMAILFTYWTLQTGIPGVEFLAKFPFCFIPAFAPPTIIFLHLLVYRKLQAAEK